MTPPAVIAFLLSALGSCTSFAAAVSCDSRQCETIPGGFGGAGNQVCCPAGQSKYGDGSACTGGSRSNCKFYGNPSLPQCDTVTASGTSLCSEAPAPAAAPTAPATAPAAIPEFAKGPKAYIKSAGGSLYIHSEKTCIATLNSCNTDGSRPNCQWKLEPSVHPNTWYIKASDQPLYLYAKEGVSVGHEMGLHRCWMTRDHSNCQWVVEPSKTRKGHFYIKSFGGDLYLHSQGGIRSGNSITLHDCPKDKDYANCQWKFEDWCADTEQFTWCSHWAGQGWCSRPEISSACQKTCGQCGPSSEIVTAPLGEWKLVGSQTNGGLDYRISEGTISKEGSSVSRSSTKELGILIANTLKFGSHFLIGKVENEVQTAVNYKHAWAIAQEMSQSLSRQQATMVRVTCDTPVANHLKVWLYQWVVVRGGYSVLTAHTRCHYTDGSQHDPECPLGACSVNNEWCEVAKCTKWNTTEEHSGERRLQDLVMV